MKKDEPVKKPCSNGGVDLSLFIGEGLTCSQRNPLREKSHIEWCGALEQFEYSL